MSPAAERRDVVAKLQHLQRDVPAWLQGLQNLDVLPIRELLSHSLYYPSSGRRGDPIKYLGGFIHSFVYVDGQREYDEIVAALEDPGDRGRRPHRFKGYDILWRRHVREEELTPNGWTLIPPIPGDSPPAGRQDGITPFALWTVHERKDNLDDNHGPQRFSLLHVCGEEVFTFQALYHTHKAVPDVVAIIQPRKGFGGNSMGDCRDQDRFLGRSVLRLNSSGKPEYLLYGVLLGQGYQPACWPDFSERVHYWRTDEGELGLWKRRATNNV